MIARLILVNTIDLIPDYGYLDRKIQDRVEIRTKDSKLWTYIFYSKKIWEIPVRFVPKSDQSVISSWWSSAASLQFYPDTSIASSWYVKIIGSEEPLRSYERPYENLFYGTITLEQL